MNIAVKLMLSMAGVFLLVGMLGGVLKYIGMMTSPTAKAHPYIDIGHRAALMYSFATLVMAQLLMYNPYPDWVDIIISVPPVLFFAFAIGRYFYLGLTNKSTNQFQQATWLTTWGMYALIIVELGGVGAIVTGFVVSVW